MSSMYCIGSLLSEGRFREYDERDRRESTGPRIVRFGRVRTRHVGAHEDASIRRSSPSAPALSSGSLRLPHFGLWTQDGQPVSHGQPSSSRAVSSTQPSKTSKPRSAIPTPPTW